MKPVVGATTIASAFVHSARITVRSVSQLRSLRTMVVTLLLVPGLEVVYLTTLATTATRSDIAAAAVSAAVLVTAATAVTAAATVVGDDRANGTLAMVLLSPLPRIVLWLGRQTVVAGIGLLAGLVAVTAAVVAAGDDRLLSSLPLLLGALVITSVSCAGLGFAVGAASLRLRNPLLPANLVSAILVLGCGGVAPPGSLPSPIETVAVVLPLTEAVKAVRAIVSGDMIEFVQYGLLTLVSGLCWFAVGSITWWLLERASRRSGSLEPW